MLNPRYWVLQKNSVAEKLPGSYGNLADQCKSLLLEYKESKNTLGASEKSLMEKFRETEVVWEGFQR